MLSTCSSIVPVCNITPPLKDARLECPHSIAFLGGGFTFFRNPYRSEGVLSAGASGMSPPSVSSRSVSQTGASSSSLSTVALVGVTSLSAAPVSLRSSIHFGTGESEGSDVDALCKQVFHRSSNLSVFLTQALVMQLNLLTTHFP